ncbi:MAG: hypothetical protein C0623_04070 [Desulfuromonas sp.]|nr:MAG: hypothetical protein C0623_04070 [Desulfuromonas sp.]
MLKDITTRSLNKKKIAVTTCEPSLDELLKALLQLWQFEVHDPAEASALLLAESGCAEPVAGQDVIWLNTDSGGAELGFSLPLEPEAFWQALEQRFHRPPRKHIRLDVDLPALISARDEKKEAVLTSLSDMGCRFSYHRELAPNESVSFEFSLEGELLTFDSRIIYAMAYSDTSDSPFRAGALFSGINAEQRARISDYLIGCYLELVRGEMPAEIFNEGLRFLELSEKVRVKLSA